jgi:lactoylglutathione lyase
MIPIHGLFEAHLTLSHLQRSMAFSGETLGLNLAAVFPDRRAAFYWTVGAGESMPGIWETGASPQRMRPHIAFKVGLSDLLEAPQRLRAANIIPLDFMGNPAEEPGPGVDARRVSLFSRSRRTYAGVSLHVAGSTAA